MEETKLKEGHMTTPRQDMRRLGWVNQCQATIKQKGGNAKILIRVQGTPGKKRTRRLSAKGPCGEIVAHSFNNKLVFIQHKADELLTSLLAIRADV